MCGNRSRRRRRRGWREERSGERRGGRRGEQEEGRSNRIETSPERLDIKEDVDCNHLYSYLYRISYLL